MDTRPSSIFFFAVAEDGPGSTCQPRITDSYSLFVLPSLLEQLTGGFFSFISLRFPAVPEQAAMVMCQRDHRDME